MTRIDDNRFRRLLLSYPAGAVRVLSDVCYRDLYNTAIRKVRDHEIARDIVQETLLLVWKNRKELSQDHPKPILCYLTRVVCNKAITWHNKQKRMQRLDELEPSLQLSFEMETNILRSDFFQQLRDVIQTFPNRERECLTLKMEHQMTLREMAFVLKVSEKAIERSLTNGFKRIRAWAVVHGKT